MARTSSYGASPRGPGTTRAASPATGTSPPTTTCRRGAPGSAPLKSLAKQLKYGKLQEEREGKDVTGNGEKREGDSGKDIELQRLTEGAKHDKSSQPSNWHFPTHNYVQASGSGERAPESLAKQMRYGELQEEMEWDSKTGNNRSAELQEEHEQGARHDKIGQPGDRSDRRGSRP